MQPSDSIRLRHMLDAALEAESFASGKEREALGADRLVMLAVIRCIEIIGEAARGVCDKVRTAHPEVPWRVITDMRNRVSHGYFDIDLDVVWNTVTRDLPKLQESVIRILAELDSEAEDSR